MTTDSESVAGEGHRGQSAKMQHLQLKIKQQKEIHEMERKREVRRKKKIALLEKVCALSSFVWLAVANQTHVKLTHVWRIVSTLQLLAEKKRSSAVSVARGQAKTGADNKTHQKAALDTHNTLADEGPGDSRCVLKIIRPEKSINGTCEHGHSILLDLSILPDAMPTPYPLPAIASTRTNQS